MANLNRNEQLVLEYVFENRLWVYTLGHPELDLLLNMDKHSVSRDDLPKFLLGLLENGWIEMVIKDNVVAYSLELLQEWLIKSPRKDYCKRQDAPLYQLTAEGGLVLERQIGIKWVNYVYMHYFEPEVMQGEADWKLLNVGSGSESNLRIAVRNIFKTMTYEELWQQGRIKVKHPWKPVYWKEVSIGYSLQILVDDSQVRAGDWEIVKWEEGLAAWRNP